MSEKKFMNSSIILFLDLMVIAVSSWLYWIVVSKLVSTSEVGLSTTVYSLVFLTGTVVGIGLEYPLLKKTATHRSRIFGSALVVEIVVTIASVPFMIYALYNFYDQASLVYIVISLGMLISVSIGFVTRYVLLGISNSKIVLLIDTVSVGVKFASGVLLTSYGLGASGVLFSFMLQTLVAACLGLIYARKQFGFGFGDTSYIKDLIKEGIVNMPSILSKTVIVSLSVVLLAAFGIASSVIGVYYIALMISIIAGGLVSSTAYMALPASAASQRDLTPGSIRIGISLTAPLISVLLVSPQFVLSIIGSDYSSGSTALLILAIGILPFAIVTNTISRLNYLGMSTKLLIIGSLQMISFILGFIVLVPQYGGEGAALSILLSYSLTCIPALLWSDKILLIYLAKTGAAVASAWVVANILRLVIPDGIIDDSVTLVTSIVVTMMMIIVLKNTSILEVKEMLKTVVKGSD